MPVGTEEAGDRWRPMTSADLRAVGKVADTIHVDHPEDDAVFSERLALYPAGCWFLESADGVSADGYVVSHPWRFAAPPKLNALLRAIPADSTTYYVHDLAILPCARGSGAAAAIVSRLADHAMDRGFQTMSLVAVNGSQPFWIRFGFAASGDADFSSYGEDARLMVRTLRG